MAKPTTIKKLLSYLVDIPLEKRKSPYNEELHVILSRGRIRLDTANATYSFQDLYASFYHSFAHLQIEKKDISKVLVLGLGLGSIPHMLYHQFGQTQAQYTVVEIDRVVIDLAQKYLPEYLSEKIDFVEANAFEFITKQQAQQNYDLIAFDVFIDETTDSIFRTTEFLQKMKTFLSPQSHLLYNMLSLKKEQESLVINFFKNDFSSIYPQSENLDLQGNRMLIWEKKM